VQCLPDATRAPQIFVEEQPMRKRSRTRPRKAPRGTVKGDAGLQIFPLLSDISEEDVIMGSQKKLQTMIDTVLSRSKSTRADAIVLNCMCTPTITGDDMDGMLQICRRKASCPVLYVNPRQQETADLLLELIKTFRVSRRPSPSRRSGNLMNLVGVPERFKDEELVPFLDSVGVQVHVCILPELDFKSIPNYLQASWQLLLEGSPEDTLYGKFFEELPIRTLRLRSPYGMTRSKVFFSQLAGALGGPGRRVAKGGRTARPDWRSWRNLRGEATKHTLCFVVDDDSLAATDFLRNVHGKPVLPMLQEMGFGVQLLLYREGPEGMPEAELRDNLDDGVRSITIRHFSSPRELDDLLGGGGFAAVYTDLFYDWRLTAAGKAQFSSREFDPGFRGALQSFDALLGICRLPFYERYGKYLMNVRRR
jgi:hypothetical protein